MTSSTDTKRLLSFFTFFFLTLYVVISLVYFRELTIPEVLNIGAIVFLWFSIQKVSQLLHWLLQFSYKKWKITKNLDKIRYELLIGLGGIVIFCTVPRIILLFFVNDKYVICYTLFVSFCAIEMFNDSFLSKHKEKWELKQELSSKFYWGIVLFHLIQLAIIFRIIFDFYEEEERPRRIINFFQVGYVKYCWDYFMDFCGIFKVGIQIAKKKKSDDVEKNALRMRCPACTQEYSNSDISKTPRVLIECRHTICEKCANELLQKNKKRKLFCPICNAVTVVKGPANLLPRSQGIIDSIDAVNETSFEEFLEALTRLIHFYNRFTNE